MPDESEIENCSIKAEKFQGSTAWVVRDGQGRRLRQFSDSNRDNVVDTWSYFRGGLEIYRDLDADFNEKADQCRWFHSAGMRWGIDADEDGSVDRWKLISAEEVAEEAVAAVQTGDLQRFERLLLTRDELGKLGLEDALGQKIAERLGSARRNFQKLTSKHQESDWEFRDFGGLRPGMVPAGTSGNDLLVYENAWVMVRHGEEFEQLQLGTMVNLGGAWKLVESPALGGATQLAEGIFYGSDPEQATAATAGTRFENEPTEKMQEILAQLEELDQQIMQVDDRQKGEYNRKRANLLLQLANASANAQERTQWLRQLADMVSAAVQDDSFPGGIAYLEALEEKLSAKAGTEDLLAYFQFQRMLARYYGETLRAADVDHAKAHAEWLQELEAFVEAHPQSTDCSEALRQLAMGSEISGETKLALKWYRRILEDHPESMHAEMARGAVVRLTSVGRSIALEGNAVHGGRVDLKEYRGKSAVVIQYWTTSSDVCKADHAVLGNLYKKYGGQRGLQIIGVNLDYTRQELLGYLEENRLPWPQLYEAGGFEGRYAKELGVVTVPLMLLVGPDGTVVSDNIQAAEIEEALKQLQEVKETASR
jgi:peroxiredoxin